MKRNILGVLVDAVDEETACERVLSAARTPAPCSATALAVHGVMTGVLDPEQRYRLNRLDLVTADGQPVRWALNLLHKAGLRKRVYGPSLMARLCEHAAREQLPIFLYGSTAEVLERLQGTLSAKQPGLVVAGAAPSRFGRASEAVQQQISQHIRESGARLVFVGLGCPRQEVFVYEMRDLVGVPLIAVGAAFDYHAGLLKEPPASIQRSGLQWLWRLVQEPTRLWRRYLLLNPLYLVLLGLQKLRLWRPQPASARAPARIRGYV